MCLNLTKKVVDDFINSLEKVDLKYFQNDNIVYYLKQKKKVLKLQELCKESTELDKIYKLYESSSFGLIDLRTLKQSVAILKAQITLH